jgi:hypothetical protein
MGSGAFFPDVEEQLLALDFGDASAFRADQGIHRVQDGEPAGEILGAFAGIVDLSGIDGFGATQFFGDEPEGFLGDEGIVAALIIARGEDEIMIGAFEHVVIAFDGADQSAVTEVREKSFIVHKSVPFLDVKSKVQY